MSAPIFLTTDEMLEVILSELPDSVFANDFANDPDVTKRSISSSELRAHARIFSMLSANLETIYNDKFLQTATADGLNGWEIDYFTAAQDANLPIELRRSNLLSKVRDTGGLTLPVITSVVAGILGNIPFEILPYSGQAGLGAWLLGASQLDYGTWLSKIDPILGARTENGLTPLDCSLDFTSEGLSAQDLLDIQVTAYEYEVRIYGNASADVIALLDKRLTQIEPARSTHLISNNQHYGPGSQSDYVAATPEFSRWRLQG